MRLALFYTCVDRGIDVREKTYWNLVSITAVIIPFLSSLDSSVLDSCNLMGCWDTLAGDGSS
jgi:hypothetical protein